MARSFTIIVDTREQAPFEFRNIKPAEPDLACRIARGKLDEGDYGLEVPMFAPKVDRIAIERKSLADLYGSFTAGRIRFEAEFKRLAEYGYAAVVVEADFRQIVQPNEHLKHQTAACPKSIVASMLAWSQRYGVHWWLCPTRQFAESLTYRALERWARDRT